MGGALGGLFGGGKKSKITSTTVKELPSWLLNPSRDLVNRTSALMDKPYEAYTGERVAGFTPDELQAFNLARQMAGQTGIDVGYSQDIMQQVAQRGLGGFTDAQIQQYMNPYVQNVLDVSRGRQLDEFDRAKRDLSSRAGQAAAFGGSRFGLQEQQMYQDFSRQLSENEMTGLAAAYDNALGQAFTGTAMGADAAMGFANLAQMNQEASMQDINALSQAGALQRQLQQLGLDVSYQDFLTEQAYPYQQIQFGSDILNPLSQIMVGGTTTDVQKQKSGGSGFLGTVLGIGSMALGIPGVGAALGGLAGSAGMGYGTASFLGNMLSRGNSIGSPFMLGWQNNYRRIFQDGGVIAPFEYDPTSDLPYLAQKHEYEREMMERNRARMFGRYEDDQEAIRRALDEREGPSHSDIGQGLKNLVNKQLGSREYSTSAQDLKNLSLETNEVLRRIASQLQELEQNPPEQKTRGGVTDEESEYLLRLMMQLSGGDFGLEAFADGGVISRVKDYWAANPAGSMSLLTDEGRRNLAQTKPIQIGNALAEAAINNPVEAAAMALMAHPAGRIAGTAGKGLMGVGKGVVKAALKKPSTASGLAGLGLLGANAYLGREQDEVANEAVLEGELLPLDDEMPPQPAPMINTGSRGASGGQRLQQATEQQSPLGFVGTRKAEHDLNMPLIAFGAALLTSPNNFFKALGEGANAFASTKAAIEDRKAKADQQQREMALAEAKLALEEKRVQAYADQVTKSNQPKPVDPFTQQLRLLQAQKLMRELKEPSPADRAMMQSLISQGMRPEEVQNYMRNLKGTGGTGGR